MYSSGESYHSFAIYSTVHEFSSMTNCSGNWEMRNFSIVDDLLVLKCICISLMSTTKYDSNINSICVESLLDVIAGNEKGIVVLKVKDLNKVHL